MKTDNFFLIYTSSDEASGGYPGSSLPCTAMIFMEPGLSPPTTMRRKKKERRSRRKKKRKPALPDAILGFVAVIQAYL
jgi:hypothetical protein